MSAVLVDITQGVVDLLNAGSFSQSFIAQRAIVPAYAADDDSELEVLVGSIDWTIDLSAGTREYSQDLYTVQIGIFDQIPRLNDGSGAIDRDQVDAMILLMQEIIDALKAAPDVAGATLIALRSRPVYDPAQLDKTNTFQSVIALDYRMLR